MPGTLRGVGGPPEADEQYRAEALEKLWELRDAELTGAGHSTPAFVAARIANEFGYPQPPRPRTKMHLDVNAQVAPRPRPRVVDWCDEDRQIVTGDHRAALMQWLPQVTQHFTTEKQMAVLDGYTEHTSLAYVRELLASEGFEQVCDVHGNAGPAPAPRALYDYHPVYAQARRDAADHRHDDPPASGPRESGDSPPTGRPKVVLVLCSRVDGFLATVHATAGGAVDTVEVFHNVMMLDHELFLSGARPSGGLALDENGVLTMIHVGSFGNQPGYRSGGSLRVRLAALRAFARPIAPWYRRPFISFGPSVELLDRVDEILAGLPGWVHDLLGPELTTPYRVYGDGAA